MVTGSNPRGGMPPGVGYEAAMACKSGLLYVMKMIEAAAGRLNFFCSGVRNSSKVLHPQCSMFPRLIAQFLAQTVHHGLHAQEATQPHLKTRFLRTMPKNICHFVPFSARTNPVVFLHLTYLSSASACSQVDTEFGWKPSCSSRTSVEEHLLSMDGNISDMHSARIGWSDV